MTDIRLLTPDELTRLTGEAAAALKPEDDDGSLLPPTYEIEGCAMNDRELLEMAAKAIGLTLRYNYLGTRDANQPWNPLDDDGDALRLAVKLCFTLSIGSYGCMVRYDRVGGDLWVEERRPGDGPHDIAEATRRAIVRAAAEIVSAFKTPHSENAP